MAHSICNFSRIIGVTAAPQRGRSGHRYSWFNTCSCFLWGWSATIPQRDRTQLSAIDFTIDGIRGHFQPQSYKFCLFPFREPRTFNDSNYTGTSIFWELNTFEYLGVQYIIQTQMKGWNLDKCLSGIRRLMTFWAGLPLSPQDRMSIAKMIVLPRLLYCFMVLLLSLYIFIFWDLKSAMSGLIWAHKRQRLYWKGNAPKDAGERGP